MEHPESVKQFMVDLHIHTALSPCADVEMTPPAIVNRARETGLHMIGVTDHNSALNVAAVRQAARGTGLCVIPGVEIQTREDIHLLCLFEKLEQLDALYRLLSMSLPEACNVRRMLGDQHLMDESGCVIGEEQRFLLTAADLGAAVVSQATVALGGIVIPAHVDRGAHGLLGILGLLPGDLDVVACEISPRGDKEVVRKRLPDAIPLLRFSDAHRLEEIGVVYTRLMMRRPIFKEMVSALTNQRGRYVLEE